MDGNTPGSSVYGISQARILEWIAIPFPQEIFLIQCSNTRLLLGRQIFATETPGKSRLLLAAAAAKSLQSCPTLCDPIDGSPPGSPVPGILQARTLEWIAISFSGA